MLATTNLWQVKLKYSRMSSPVTLTVGTATFCCEILRDTHVAAQLWQWKGEKNCPHQK